LGTRLGWTPIHLMCCHTLHLSQHIESPIPGLKSLKIFCIIDANFIGDVAELEESDQERIDGRASVLFSILARTSVDCVLVGTLILCHVLSHMSSQ
jgi:hypothetical protein